MKSPHFHRSKVVPYLLIVALFFSCSEGDGVVEEQVETAEFFPFSDQQNVNNWKLNHAVSDEFEDEIINQGKWLIQGTNGEYQSNHRGRAPSQFSINNVRLEDGKLKLETRWEPDYNFSPTEDKDGFKYENITTAAVITKSEFKYGYIEVKSKAADAEISSAFWATGYNTEFDFYEMFGDHNQEQKLWKERELWWSIHDWTPIGKGKTTYTEQYDLGFRIADDFHVYGYDWSEEGVKIYVDGVLLSDVSIQDINSYDDVENNYGGNGRNANYVITRPIKIWFSQATFPWHGIPDSKDELGNDGSVDFEIEYLRIWQRN